MSDRTQEPPLAAFPLLARELEPIAPWLGRNRVIEISINEPGRVWVEEAEHGYRAHRAPAIDEDWAEGLCNFLANVNRITFTRDLQVLACRLPGGHRFHAVLGRENVVSGMAISIRNRRDIAVGREDYGWTPGRDFSGGAALPGPAPPAAPPAPPGTL